MRWIAMMLVGAWSLGVPGRALGGDLRGTVTWKGPPPKVEMLPVNKNMKECGKEVASQALEVKDGKVADVVVTVKGEGLSAPPPVAAQVMLDQKLCHYVPHVQVAPVGSTLEILNNDPFLHNIHGRIGSRTTFNLAMPLKGMKIARPLRTAGTVHVQCDVHNFMSGWVLVVDSPAAVSGADGTFVITGLPAGTYDVTAWQERLGTKTAKVTVPATGAATADFSFGG